MRQKLQTLLFALVAIMMPIGASAYVIHEEPVEIIIGESGVATLYYSSSSLVIPDGVTASIITGIEMEDDGTVRVVEQNLDGVIPFECAVILRGDEGLYSFERFDDNVYIPSLNDNLLQGTDEEESVDKEDGCLYFYLSEINGKADWVYSDENEELVNQAHNAYLVLYEEAYPGLVETLNTLNTLENPHLQHTHGGCEICDEITSIEAAWGTSADDLTSYGALEDAIFNAGEEGSNIGYIKLLADVEDEIYVQGGNFTLDLNGHTISSELHTLYIQNNSIVTIVDGSETKSGKVISSGEGCFAVGITNSASVTIEEGTYESTLLDALNLEGNSSITINGGSYESFYRPVQIGEGCSATITGGTFTSTSSYAITNNGTLDIEGGTFISEVHFTLDTNGTLIIKGGEFSAGENYAVLEYSGGTIDLSEFDQGITAISVRNTSGNDIVLGEETILLPEGYCFYKGEKIVTELVYTESYTIGEAPTIEDAEAVWYESEEAETPLGFGSLSDAIAAAAEEGSTVGYIQLKADVENEIYVEGGNFTLDLNGHTISCERHTLYIRNLSNVTIVDNSETKSGKVISSGEGSFAVGIANSASVTINGGTYESTLHYALNLEGNGSATINGGSYESPYRPVFIGEDCSATITGGTFKYSGTNAIENYGNLVVEGGTFTYDGDGDVDPDSYYTTINHFGGSIDLSNYPTDAINSIDITNDSGEDITPGAETILLPEGYCFFDYSDDTPVTVLEYGAYYIDVEPAKCTIAFNAGDGEGEMEGEIIYEGVDYALPECTFNAPEGMMFKAWLVGEEEYQPGDDVTIEDNTTITALWTEFVPQIVIKMSDSCGDGWNGASITVKKDGVELDETVTIEDGTEATVTLVYDLDSRYTFYWNMGQDGGNSDGECEFEIIVNGKSEYTGLGSDFSDDIEFFFALGDPFVVSFNANDGSGSMDDIETYESVTLPECTFTAPEGMMFKAWLVGEEEYQPEDEIVVTEDTEIKAVWTEFVPQIVINMSDYYGDSWNGASITVMKDGEELEMVSVEEGYTNTTTITYDPTSEYTFYWTEGYYDNECSFEIIVNGENVFEALLHESESGTVSDCEDLTTEEPFFTLEIAEVTEIESLTIADGELTEYSAKLSHVGTLTYTRTLPNLMWNALYVPFEIPVSELAENYDVAYINDVHSYDNNEDGEIDDLKMEVIKITTGTLNANYPYLIRAKNEEAKEMSIVLTDVTLYTTSSNTVSCSSVFMQFDVTGTYSQMSSEDLNGSLVITTDGSWKQLAENSVLRPFRLYLTMTALDGSPVKVSEQAARSMRIVARGESEGTTSIDNGQWTTEDETVVYDLQGRRVAQPTKGMYIVNGRKVVIK